jgi:hypothetical protein
MKARDRENLEATLRSLFANFARVIAIGAIPVSVGVLLRAAKMKLTRYDRKGVANLPSVLAALESGGVLDVRKSHGKGIASAVVLEEGIRATLSRFRFRPEHFAQAPGREVVFLGRTTRDHVDGTVERELIEYRETPETTRYRQEVERINRFIAAADIRMELDGGPLVVTSMRECRRYFNLPPGDKRHPVRFDRGGRLFGGWWQTVSKSRRHAIRINGEPVADLDFASMFLRLALLEAGVVPPEGDLYAVIPGLSEPRWRAGVKKATAALLFAERRLVRLPGGIAKSLPKGLTGPQFTAAFLAAYPDLEPVLWRGIGHRLMFTESRILIASILCLIDHGIPALGMHDGLMVPNSHVEQARAAMHAACLEVVGAHLPITLKKLWKAF